jgi:hypothetical protein
MLFSVYLLGINLYNNIMRLAAFKEAIVVGVSTLAVGMAMKKSYEVLKWNVPDSIFYFLLGFWTHLAWEIVGGNRWYVENVKFPPKLNA